jgi:hypothetical protein
MHLLSLLMLSIAGSFSITYLINGFKSVSASYLGVFSVILVTALFCIYRKELVRTEHWMQNLILSVLMSLSTVGGIFLDAEILPENSDIIQTVKFLLLSICIVPAFYCLLQALLRVISWMISRERINHFPELPANRFLYWFIITAVILLAWTPVWLAYYPGLWNYDPWQVWQFINHQYDTVQPLIHTLLMGFCFNTGYARGDSNLGVAIYDWVQMVIMASIFSYSVLFLKRKTGNRLLCFLTVIFYAVFPVNSILAISSTKDVLFSGLVLLNTIFAFQYIDCVREMKSRREHLLAIIDLILGITAMLLFRNNASYAFTGVLVIAILLVLCHKIPWKTVLLLAFCLALYFSCNIALTKGLQASKGRVTEALSVSAQQFGRIYYSDGKDEDIKRHIEEYCNVPNMSYDPHLADTMKAPQVLDHIHSWRDAVPFLKTSLQLLVQYPLVSIDSFLYLTEGWWYLGDVSCANIYPDGLEKRFGYLMTNVYEDFGITHESKFPALERFLENAFTANNYQQWPIISILFAPALYIWLFVFIFLNMKKSDRYPFAFHCFLLLTNLFGPCCLVRYAYPFIVTIPLMLGIAATDKDKSFARKA